MTHVVKVIEGHQVGAQDALGGGREGGREGGGAWGKDEVTWLMCKTPREDRRDGGREGRREGGREEVAFKRSLGHFDDGDQCSKELLPSLPPFLPLACPTSHRMQPPTVETLPCLPPSLPPSLPTWSKGCRTGSIL
jgi:hypothetical protein